MFEGTYDDPGTEHKTDRKTRKIWGFGSSRSRTGLAGNRPRELRSLVLHCCSAFESPMSRRLEATSCGNEHVSYYMHRRQIGAVIRNGLPHRPRLLLPPSISQLPILPHPLFVSHCFCRPSSIYTSLLPCAPQFCCLRFLIFESVYLAEMTPHRSLPV